MGYVYKENGDTIASLSVKLDMAAKEVGVVLTSKKRREMLREFHTCNKVLVSKNELKQFKYIDGVTIIKVSKDNQTVLNGIKIEKRFSSYDEVITDCLSKLQAIEKMIDGCNGDDNSCKDVCASLYDLFNGGKR